MSEPIGTDENWRGFEGRYPAIRVRVARLLWDEISGYVRANGLDWTPATPKGRWWLGYKRSGRYFVATVSLYVEKPVLFAVKIPESPDALDLKNPYPDLESSWDEPHKQWTWHVPNPSHIPDVALAIDISRRFQPESGPMRTPATGKARKKPANGGSL